MCDIVAYYDQHAPDLSAQYDRLRFEDVHRGMLPFLPLSPAAVLDVGAGSGRDAAALAERGYHVTAVEPAQNMRRASCQRTNGLPVEWIDDRLPALARLARREESFAFILCSAVFMHVMPSELGAAFCQLRSLLAAGGYVGITVRGASSADPRGLFHEHDSSLLIDLAAGAELRLVEASVDGDRLGRAGLAWRTFLFVRQLCGVPAAKPALPAAAEMIAAMVKPGVDLRISIV